MSARRSSHATGGSGPTGPGAADAPLLEARALAVGVDGRRLFEGLSFVARAGETWAVVGPNGAGKTTLMRTLAGFAAPLSGSIDLGGRPLAGWPLAARARMRAWLPQDDRDAFSATVTDSVLAARHPHVAWHAFERGDDRNAVAAALCAFDLGHLAQRDVRTLSGGERRRVALAELVAQETPLLLVDEPSAHLDVAQQVAALDALTSVVRARGRTLLMVLHDLALAARYADRMILVGGGQAEAGDAASLLEVARLSSLFGRALAELGEGRVRAFVPR